MKVSFTLTLFLLPLLVITSSCTKEALVTLQLKDRSFMVDERTKWFFERTGVIHQQGLCNRARWRVEPNGDLVINFGYQDVVYEDFIIDGGCIRLLSYASVPRTICPIEWNPNCNVD